MLLLVSEVKGSEYFSIPVNREIDFGFDFDSFVRCDAKLCERVRSASSTLGLRLARSSSPPSSPALCLVHAFC